MINREKSRLHTAGFWLLAAAAVVTGTLCEAATDTVRPPVAAKRADIEAVLAKAPKPAGAQLRQLNVVLLADVKDHGENEHDYPMWQKRWALLLGGAAASNEKQANIFGPGVPDANLAAGVPEVNVSAAWQWPTEEQFKSANVIVAHCYLKWNPGRLKQVEEYLSRGGGWVMVHPASWTQPKPSEEAAKLFGVGGYKQYRHGHVAMRIVDVNNPICQGLPAMVHFLDETYFPAAPQVDIEALATSDEKLDPNSSEMSPQVMFWTHKYGKGRVFGCVPGHYMWTFDDPYFRILLLRGIAWAAGESPYRFDSVVLRGARVNDEKK